MNLKNFCFNFNSYNQTLEILKLCNKKQIIPIFFFKYHLVDRFGVDWLIEVRDLLTKEIKSNDYKVYVDVKKNYGLFISLVEEKINYLKVKADKNMLRKLNQIAKLNKVLINPSFSIVDLTKSKNKKAKLVKLLNK